MAENGDLWNPSSYENSNGAQYRDASELIDKIVENKITSVDIIVDLGCGSGNVTALLGSRIQHEKIYACDFNQKVIEYANEVHNKDGKIEYFVQDLGLPWDELDERLKNLEGKVSLVFSNRAIHWIQDRAEVVKTIVRLLKPGGHCYIHASLRRDLLEFMSEEERQDNLKLLNVESHEEQYQSYKTLFEKTGLAKFSIVLLLKEWRYNTEEEYHEQFSVLEEFLRAIIRENVPKEKHDEIIAKFLPWLEKIFHTKNGLDFHIHSDPDIKHIYNDMFQIIGTK